MSSKSYPYLTKSKHGIWYFQRWAPKSLRRLSSSLRPIFRISLRTRSKQEALRLSRIYMVNIDKFADKYFDNPKQFGRAMELLAKSVIAENSSTSFEEYEDIFLSDLDELDDSLLSDAKSFQEDIQNESERLRKLLVNSDSRESRKDIERLITSLLKKKDSLPDSKNPSLEDLFSQWKEANNNKPSVLIKIAPSIDLFIRYQTHATNSSIRVSELDVEHIHGYQKMYENLPLGTAVQGVSIANLLKLKGKRKSPKTIRDNFSHINLFLGWIITKGYPLKPNLTIVMSKGSDVEVNEKTSKRRVPLSDEDLKKFFRSKEYTESGNFLTSAMYWAPLIAAFTGARLMEILQLEKHDIKKEDGIWVFDFDDLNMQSNDDLKRLKCSSSRRQVPIHPEILKLGFIDYVDSCSGRLFPDEERNKHGKFDRFQKRQGNYRKKVGVVPAHEMEMRDFHSFRHTVETRLTEIRSIGPRNGHFDTGIIDGILGHASKGRSTGQSTYNHSQYVTAKHNALKRLKYDSVDFAKIIDWRKCKFYRKPFQQKLASQIR